MRSLHILLFLSPLGLVAAQDCDASDPFGENCDDSAPAIAIDGAQAECSYILTNCPGGFPAANLCVTYWCKTGCADPDNCCASSNPSSCFQSSSGTPNSSSDSSSSENSSGSSSPEGPGVEGCDSISSYVSYCESATPGFSTLPNTAQASCFCFNQNGGYNGTAWDAATTCYAAIATQTTYPASELSAYSADIVGACTKFVDAGVLSEAGVSSGGAAATAAPAGTASSSGSAMATETGSTSSTASEGTASSTSPTASAKSGANKALEGCGILIGAILGVSCIFASYQH